MSKWAERAAAHFSEKPPEATPITPETNLLGVLGAPPQHILKKCDVPLDSLIAAGMLACDKHGDSEDARQDMRTQLAEVPEDHRADLLDHFRSAYRVTS